MFYNLALKSVDGRLGWKPDSPYRVDPFVRYSGKVNVKASKTISMNHEVQFNDKPEGENRKDTSVLNMKWGDDGQNKSDHTFDRDKYLMFLTHQFYNENNNKMTVTGKMERNATKGENQYEPGLQVELDDVAGFRLACQAMHNMKQVVATKKMEHTANLQVSAFNDDLWFGFNVKRNMGEAKPLEAAKKGEEAIKGDQNAMELIIAGAYYNVNKDLQVFARGDFVNHFVSAGNTYKAKDFTMSSELFYGMPGKDPKTGGDKKHGGFNDSPCWLRMGVDMPVSKGTNVSWKGMVADKVMSELSFKQNVGDKTNVEFVNKYVNGKVDVGMNFNYNV